MYLFFGIALIVLAVIQIVFMDKIFDFHEKWKYDGNAEPSWEYVATQYIGGGMGVVIGLIFIIVHLMGK